MVEEVGLKSRRNLPLANWCQRDFSLKREKEILSISISNKTSWWVKERMTTVKCSREEFQEPVRNIPGLCSCFSLRSMLCVNSQEQLQSIKIAEEVFPRMKWRKRKVKRKHKPKETGAQVSCPKGPTAVRSHRCCGVRVKFASKYRVSQISHTKQKEEA